MLKIKTISDVVGKKVYTDEGDFFGVVERLTPLIKKIIICG